MASYFDAVCEIDPHDSGEVLENIRMLLLVAGSNDDPYIKIMRVTTPDDFDERAKVYLDSLVSGCIMPKDGRILRRDEDYHSKPSIRIVSAIRAWEFERAQEPDPP